MGRDNGLRRQGLETRQDAALHRGGQVKLRLFERHEEAFGVPNSPLSEMEQQKKTLKGNQAATLAFRWNRRLITRLIMRRDCFKDAGTVGRRHAKPKRRSPAN